VLNAQAPHRRTAFRFGVSDRQTDSNERSKRQHMVCHFVTVYANPAKYELGVFLSSDPDAGGLVESGKLSIGNRARGPKIAQQNQKQPFQAEKNDGRGEKSRHTRLPGDFDVQSAD
jgi:hypothetical protein